jgi:succinyl-diaminopimelate desuccinylase
MSNTVKLAQELIRRPSVTPEDAGCQDMMIERLEALDFEIERLRFKDVDNFWARRGSQSPLFVFAGHTDVVPPGPLDEWSDPPFEAKIVDGNLYGRGAADMKGSLAAMITATESFVKRHPEHPGSLGFLITSDEEGPSINGTRKVMEWLKDRDETIDYCLVGEPSSTKNFGDIIKNGRRGSLGAVLTVKGVQGHVAYPERADNPIHNVAPVLADLVSQSWDSGNEFFPPTTFQISNINAGTGANNVIPGGCEIVFNFRFSTEVTHEELKRRTIEILKKHKLRYSIAWQFNGPPFITSEGPLLKAIMNAIFENIGLKPMFSTTGGTSDGRFIAPTGAHVVEFGPLNDSIHKVNEWVSAVDLELLHEIYETTLEKIFGLDSN